MKEINIILNINKKKIKVNIVPKWYEAIGLMFKSKEYSKNLLFKFKNKTKQAIHSCFVFYKFYAIWCDENFNIIDFKIVNPWRLFVIPRRKYKYLIEIPIKNSSIFSRRELDELLERFK